MEWNFRPGDSLVLELHDECLIGELVFINAQKTDIHLKNVHDFYNQNANVSKSVQIFYKSEIKSISLLQKSRQNQTKDCDENSSSSVVDMETLAEMKSMIDSVIVLYQINIRYFESIKTLSKCDTIGVAFEGVQYGRNSRLSLVTATNGTTIYIFDCMSIGTLPKELGEILQSSTIQKVVHDSRRAADNLMCHFKIRLTYVFDTMIANAAITGDHKSCTLFECISKYFKLPPNNADKLAAIKWDIRPICEEKRRLAAQNVVYLKELHQHLTRTMLQPFYQSVDTYMDKLRSMTDEIDNATEFIYNRNRDIEMVDKFELNLSESISSTQHENQIHSNFT